MLASTEPEQLESLIVDSAPLALLDVHDLPRLKEALGHDELFLHSSIEEAIATDRASAAENPKHTRSQMQRWALQELAGHATSHERSVQLRRRQTGHLFSKTFQARREPTRGRESSQKASRRRAANYLKGMP